MTLLEARIPAALAGERADRAAAIVSDLSRSVVARLIDEGAVRLDGERVRVSSLRVVAGQLLQVDMPAPVDPRPVADPSVEVLVRYEDDDVIVVDKAAGMVVHPGPGHTEGTMVGGIVARFPEIAAVGEVHRPGIVHRLDRGTSGLLVVARNQAAYENLVDQLQRHEPIRVYGALVWGHPDSDSGTVDAPIGRSSRHPTRMTVTDQGRPAVTHYDVVDRYQMPRACTLISCRLETGRTHQIRVHMAAIGHPVVGDRDYGGVRPGLELSRPFLHSARLSFVHPGTGDTVSFESPLPTDLEDVLARCGE